MLLGLAVVGSNVGASGSVTECAVGGLSFVGKSEGELDGSREGCIVGFA